MPVLLPAVSPTNSFTQQDAFPDQRNYNQYAIFVRIKNSVALDFTDNDLVTNATSFGYRLRGASGNELRASYRFSTTEDRFHPVTTGEYTNVILTLNRNDETVRHYFDGVQSGAAIDITGEPGFFASSAYDIQGSPTALHDFEFERLAEWRDSLPTAQDIIDLESGAAFADLQNPPTASYEPVGPNGNHVAVLVDETGTNDMPQTSGPTSGGLEPVYSGAADAVNINLTGRVLNRDAHGSSMTQNFTGTFSGKTPTGIEFRVTQSGVPLPGLDWQAVANEVIGVDVWSGDIGAIPVGDDYIIQVRDAGDTQVIGSGGPFNVGIVVAWYGQSNATRQYAGVPTTPVVPNANCYCRYIGSWQQLNTSIMEAANRISDLNGGISVGILCEGQGATGIADLAPGSTIWDAEMVPALADVNNQIEAAAFTQGENDAGDDMVAYRANLDAINSEFLSITGRTPSEFVFLENQSGTDNNASAGNESYVELRETQKSWADDTASAQFSATTIDADKVDSLHYTNDWYLILNRRIAKSFQNAIGLDAVDGAGPELLSFYIDGATLRVRFSLRGATGMTQTGTGDLTGFRLWTDNTLSSEVAITSATLDGDEAVITPAVVPDQLMTVTHLRLTNPPVTNLIAGTGYDIGDIAAQMGIAEFGDVPLQIDQQTTNASITAEPHVIEFGSFDVSQQAANLSVAATIHVIEFGEEPLTVTQQTTQSSVGALSHAIGFGQPPLEVTQETATASIAAINHRIQIGNPVRISSFTINWA